jgi:hypothetical protein
VVIRFIGRGIQERCWIILIWRRPNDQTYRRSRRVADQCTVIERLKKALTQSEKWRWSNVGKRSSLTLVWRRMPTLARRYLFCSSGRRWPDVAMSYFQWFPDQYPTFKYCALVGNTSAPTVCLIVGPTSNQYNPTSFLYNHKANHHLICNI